MGELEREGRKNVNKKKASRTNACCRPTFGAADHSYSRSLHKRATTCNPHMAIGRYVCTLLECNPHMAIGRTAFALSRSPNSCTFCTLIHRDVNRRKSTRLNSS